jgi:AhpD family alkylhydroperoxidase
MSLNLKEKELAAVGASVAAGCKPCTNYHLKKVRETGASYAEINKAILNAVNVRDSAKKIMEAHALKHPGTVQDNHEYACNENTTRIKELVSVAAAFAVNCTSNLEKHIALAQRVGISDSEVKSVLDLALFVKGQASSHVDRIAERIRNKVSSMEKSEESSGCSHGDSEAETPGSNQETVAATASVEEEDCGCGGDC